MSFIPVPASYAWLQTADPNTVRHEHFIQCMTDYITWQRACGVPDEYGFTDPETFIEAGGLQEYINVVNWWPTDPKAPRLASLSQMITLSKFLYEDARKDSINVPTIKYLIDDEIERARKWLKDNGGNPDDPNETKAEKAARLNRARVAKHRTLHANEFTDDPNLNALIIAAKNAERSAAAGRKWIKGEIKQAKSDMDAAILAAKSERVARVQRAEEALALAERAAADAQEVVRQYKSQN